MRWLAVLLAATSTLTSAGCGNARVMTSPFAVQAPVRTAPTGAARAARFANRVVVKYRHGASQAALRSFHQRFALASVRDVSALGLGVLRLPAGTGTEGAISRLQGHPAVEFVEPDYVFTVPRRPGNRQPAAKGGRTLASVGFDGAPWTVPQWGLTKIGMPQVWPVNGGSPAVTVAVIDTGVDPAHPDLAGAVVPGTNVLPNATGPDDDHGHGTHVAGIIAASVADRKGVSGVAPNCRIMPVKVLDGEGKGDTGDIVAGLIWAVNHGARVVNMSLGGAGGSRALAAAIAYARSKDVVVVAAMGNEGANIQEYPAGYPGVIAVGATDQDDAVADFSNHGSWISVAAPGVDILSALPRLPVGLTRMEGKEPVQDVMDGTSMAAPFVAGVAALIRSANPMLSAPEVRSRIERTCDDVGPPGFDAWTGWGRINARRALLGQ
ncbi:MAG: S8 family peptidase [Candidatus Sericytochromatia bacterium]|nr:S8 family peptidase [Candidatus Sericytochromatia bacterium]